MLYINENVFVCMTIFDNHSVTRYSETSTFREYLNFTFKYTFVDIAMHQTYVYIYIRICFKVYDFPFGGYVCFPYACVHIHVKKRVCRVFACILFSSSQLSALVYISRILLVSPCTQYSIPREKKEIKKKNEKLSELSRKTHQDRH